MHKHSGISWEIHEGPWMRMNINVYLWIFIDIHVHPRRCMHVYSSSTIHNNSSSWGGAFLSPHDLPFVFPRISTRPVSKICLCASLQISRLSYFVWYLVLQCFIGCQVCVGRKCGSRSIILGAADPSKQNGGHVVQSDAGVGIGIGMGWGVEEKKQNNKKAQERYQFPKGMQIFYDLVVSPLRKMEVNFHNVFSPKAPSTRSP